MNKSKFYAGIGARDTPTNILSDMTSISSILEDNGYTLRSGGAIGSDSAFERGVKNLINKEIFTVKNMNNFENYQRSLDSVNEFHPNPSRLSGYPRLLMARNYMQLFGKNLNSYVSNFIICWTKDGKIIGGTGQALRMAKTHNIKVYNLALMSKEDILIKILNQGSLF